jgi:ribosomal protein L17
MPYQKLSRKSGPRRALLRGLVTSFLRTGRIETTAARAAAIR